MNAQRVTKGSKYDSTKGLDIRAIAKLVRGDIASAIADGDLPAGSSASVRIRSDSQSDCFNVRFYSHITLVAAPESLAVAS